MNKRPQCPYCMYDLGQMPKRKKKCPNCNKIMFLKRLPSGNKIIIMTEKQAEKVDMQYKLKYEKDEALDYLKQFGMSVKHLEEECKSKDCTVSEAFTFLLHKVIGSTSDLHEKQMAYYKLAIIFEASNQPFFDFLKKSKECELLNYKKSGTEKVTIMSAGKNNSCDKCECQNGKIFTLANALRTMPLPCSDCTKTLSGDALGFCRCCYCGYDPEFEVFFDDEKGLNQNSANAGGCAKNILITCMFLISLISLILF